MVKMWSLNREKNERKIDNKEPQTHIKTLSFVQYHIKYGWFRYLLSYVLGIFLIMPIGYGVLLPLLMIGISKLGIPVTTIVFVISGFITLLVVTNIQALMLRHITKGYMHYANEGKDKSEFVKVFRKRHYLMVLPFFIVIMSITFVATGYLFT